MTNQNNLRVTRKQSKVSRFRATKLISEVQKYLWNKKIKFTYKLVGSGAWWTIIKDKDGMYDLDYQIILTANSNYLNNPTELKKLFYASFYKLKSESEKLEDSTTAITLINEKEKYSFDFVILKTFPDNKEIIRRNNDGTENKYTWNELKELSNLYKYFKYLLPKEKQIIIEKMVIPEKIKEKMKDKNLRKPSYEILLSKINEYKTKYDEINNYQIFS